MFKFKTGNAEEGVAHLKDKELAETSLIELIKGGVSQDKIIEAAGFCMKQGSTQARIKQIINEYKPHSVEAESEELFNKVGGEKEFILPCE